MTTPSTHSNTTTPQATTSIVSNATRLAELRALADDALPLDGKDYGTDRQITAENKFFERCTELFPKDFEEGSRFHNYCIKATPEEMMAGAIEILERRLGGDTSSAPVL